jgi:hypothetical protein
MRRFFLQLNYVEKVMVLYANFFLMKKSPLLRSINYKNDNSQSAIKLPDLTLRLPEGKAFKTFSIRKNRKVGIYKTYFIVYGGPIFTL